MTICRILYKWFCWILRLLECVYWIGTFVKKWILGSEEEKFQGKGVIPCTTSNQHAKNLFREYCVSLPGNYSTQWYSKEELQSYKGKVILTMSGGEGRIGNAIEALRDMDYPINKKETMLVIMSYCLYNDRRNPPNILHGVDKPEFVEEFTNIIYDNELRFYKCVQNDLAFSEIKNFLDI